MSREECVGSTTPALKLGGSPAPSSGLFRLARVLSAWDEISCRQQLRGKLQCVLEFNYSPRKHQTTSTNSLLLKRKTLCACIDIHNNFAPCVMIWILVFLVFQSQDEQCTCDGNCYYKIKFQAHFSDGRGLVILVDGNCHIRLPQLAWD